jgi:hypothetical protein
MAPTIHHGLLDYGQPWSLPTVKLFTGNPVRRSDGALVMGRGAAQAVRDRWPTVQYGITITPGRPLAWFQIEPDQWIGWFQVKHHWREPACPDLIRASSQALAAGAAARPSRTFELNAPGVGNGRLSWADVEPLLDVLPSNVHVYLQP